MTSLRTDLAHYLQLRHRLGHDLADAARLLPRYLDYLEESGQTTVTVSNAVQWSQEPQAPPGSSVRSRRMTAVRGFARYRTGIDPATEVPPLGLFTYQQHWRPPFIFTTDDIVTLLDAAAAMQSPLRSATYSTLFGLLAATGMRVGEALTLDRADIDWDQGVLLIRQSKFGKSRNVPVASSTLDALHRYTLLRSRFRPQPGNDSFFVSLTGRRLIYVSVFEVFRDLREHTGLGATSTTTPRIHDLRHTFAVTVLLGWYRDGGNVAARLPWLSTYLGHRDPRSTYWYLSAAPELLALAADRLKRFAWTVPS
jgi:integrase/recombinase XerD